MNSEQFEAILQDQIDKTATILGHKAREYATDVDRLHNFKVAAELENTTTRNALAGMMAKHTVSIYDMCGSPAEMDLELWNEKITDHINYLILLRAVIIEEQDADIPLIMDDEVHSDTPTYLEN